MKSFIGAVKVMARVIQHCSALLAPLDDAIAGKTSHDNITWTEEVYCAFNKVKECLSSSRSVTLPRSDDQLWIVSDGAVRRPGIAATLYIMRNNKLALAGFFSVRLPNHQLRLPCEVEALAIAATVKHFGPYIIQSSHRACVPTDSKPMRSCAGVSSLRVPVCLHSSPQQADSKYQSDMWLALPFSYLTLPAVTL